MKQEIPVHVTYSIHMDVSALQILFTEMYNLKVVIQRPLATLRDRTNRRQIESVGVVLRSSTQATSFAFNFQTDLDKCSTLLTPRNHHLVLFDLTASQARINRVKRTKTEPRMRLTRTGYWRSRAHQLRDRSLVRHH
jgi:hypothetical protein